MRRRIVLFTPFVFRAANISLRFMAHLLRKYVIAPTVRNKKICRGDSRIARDDVRSIFRLQHMFALTKSLPPRGRGTAAGFPETSLSSFWGSCVSGGRSLRDIKNLSILFFSHSPSVAPRQGKLSSKCNTKKCLKRRFPPQAFFRS